MTTTYDIAIVGAGIVGLAHALAAAHRDKRVIVIDRDAQANGASVRNFGFVTVTGQRAGSTWQRARRSRDVWAEIAPFAGIPVIHRGLFLAARRPEALAVLEEFAAGPMGAGCEILTATALRERCPMLRTDGLVGGLWSPHELRVEAREAVPRLAAYLAKAYGVTFLRNTLTRNVAPPDIDTTAGPIQAETAIVCPGTDLLTLFPERLAQYELTLSKLHMLRLAPQPADWKLPGSIMTDPSLVRYEGYMDCPSVPALRARIRRETPETLPNGVHLIVVQSADGSLVVGDSHHYATTPDPFAPTAVDDLILRHATETLSIPDMRVVERWLGEYPSWRETSLIERPNDATRLVLVTSGTGMSTAFGLAEEVIAELYG